MAWVTSDEVIESWIGSGVPTDMQKVADWIGRAERLIRRSVPDIQSRIDEEADLDPVVTDTLDTAKDIVVSVVSRVFRNPEGIRQRNETTGPFTGSVTYGGDQPGGLSLTDDELSQLLGITGGQQAFIIDLMGDPNVRVR